MQAVLAASKQALRSMAGMFGGSDESLSVGSVQNAPLVLRSRSVERATKAGGFAAQSAQDAGSGSASASSKSSASESKKRKQPASGSEALLVDPYAEAPSSKRLKSDPLVTQKGVLSITAKRPLQALQEDLDARSDDEENQIQSAPADNDTFQEVNEELTKLHARHEALQQEHEAVLTRCAATEEELRLASAPAVEANTKLEAVSADLAEAVADFYSSHRDGR
jgi:hypothetical protein